MTRLLLLVAVVLVGIWLYRRYMGGGERVTAAQFLEREPNALVVDVRTPAEFASGHVTGARNVNVTAPDFREQMNAVDRDRPLYLYCRTGNRSGQAAQILKGMGFTNAVNAGGFSDLEAAGAPTQR